MTYRTLTPKASTPRQVVVFVVATFTYQALAAMWAARLIHEHLIPAVQPCGFLVALALVFCGRILGVIEVPTLDPTRRR